MRILKTLCTISCFSFLYLHGYSTTSLCGEPQPSEKSNPTFDNRTCRLQNNNNPKAPHPKTKREEDYRKEWCQALGGEKKRFDDRTECDCETDRHAIEFDFGKKWKEALGQALHYSLKSDKKAGIVLILDGSETDKKYYKSLDKVITHFRLPVDVWVVFKDESKTYKQCGNGLSDIIKHFGQPVDVWTGP